MPHLVMPIDDSGKIVYYPKPKPKPQLTQLTEPPPVKLWQPAPHPTIIYETKKIVVPDKSTPKEKPKSKIKYYERYIINAIHNADGDDGFVYAGS